MGAYNYAKQIDVSSLIITINTNYHQYWQPSCTFLYLAMIYKYIVCTYMCDLIFHCIATCIIGILYLIY